MIVAITGHRPNKLGGYKVPNALYNSVINGLNEAFDKLKPDFVLTGMAIGVDQWAAEICVKRGIKYIAAIPFQGQESQWPSYAQERYDKLIKKSHAAYVITPGPYAAHKMHLRNQWLVNSCDVLAAVWDGTSGGTASCIEFAKSRGRKIFWVPFDNASQVPVLEAPKVPLPSLPKVVIQAEFKKDDASKFLESIKEKAKEQAEEFKKKLKLSAPSKAMKPEVTNDINSILKQIEEGGIDISQLKKLLTDSGDEKSKGSAKKKDTTPKHIYGRIIDID